MKKLLIVIMTLSLCCLCLLINIAPINAANPAYTHMTYFLANPVTLDGSWTNPTEWSDTTLTTFGNTSDCIFRSKWGASSDFSQISQYILVEILNDNTNDTNDYWQFCFDGDATARSAPGSADIRVDIIGHTSLTQYVGSGTGWTPTSASATFTWNNKMVATPTSSTPHWVLEVIINHKPDFGIGANYWLRVAYFDASKAAAGVQAWPPTSRDVPNDWGDIPYDMNPIPEVVNFGVVILLSGAVVVGSFALRKKKPSRLAAMRPM